MRLIVSICIVLSFFATKAQVNSGNKALTLFTVDKTPVSTDEFLHLYRKNSLNKAEKSSEQGVKEYLDLLINFKLKVAEAHARGMDTTQKFNKEFKTYREELKRPYRAEPDALDKLTRDTFERLKEEVKASHILIMVKLDASPADTLAAYEKIIQARNRVLKGESFEKVAGEISEEPSAKYNFGNLVTYKVDAKIDRTNKVLKHIVHLKYKDNATKEQVDKAVQAFGNLKNQIPSVVNLEWGLNDSTEGHTKGLTHTFVITFKDENARENYLFHKAHLELLKNYAPFFADAVVMDFWADK